VLFDARAHEPLIEAAWRPEAAAAEIRAIAAEADGALRDGEWWPLHPLDAEEGDPDVFRGIYLGAAGMLWALHHLAQTGVHEPAHDYARLAQEVRESYLRRPELGKVDPSLWMGEGGITLVAWLLSPTPALADRLAELVTVPENDTLELMWGSPGLLAIADAMLERTGEKRWALAWDALAEHLMGEWREDVWTQRLYGSEKAYLGPAHGFAGIVAALARRLPSERLAPRANAALAAQAVREGAYANWPALAGERLEGAIRTQWCHGAPGMVASFCALAGDDALLLAGGELTWAAGPLAKGANLCHGTAGNGYAFLKLFARTGDELWLERARRFAMHAAAQVATVRAHHGHGRHSLWTGDIGTAVYLQQCLVAGSGLPGLELW
jgi:hypothetical protein